MTERTHCANCGGEVAVDKPHKLGECPHTMTDPIAAILAAEAQAEADHLTGACAASEWSCSWCEGEA